jgi:hypothetical protein
VEWSYSSAVLAPDPQQQRADSPEKVFGLIPSRLTTAAGVLHNNAHTGGHNVLAHFAHHPVAGMIHLYDGADPLGRSQAEHGYRLRLGNRVAIQRDDVE